MSPRSSNPDSPQPGVYEGLMFVALAALLAGITFLVLELGKYGWSPAG